MDMKTENQLKTILQDKPEKDGKTEIREKTEERRNKTEQNEKTGKRRKRTAKRKKTGRESSHPSSALLPSLFFSYCTDVRT